MVIIAVTIKFCGQERLIPPMAEASPSK